MPGWLLIIVGIAAGQGTSAGGIYLAVRHHLRPIHEP